MSESSQGWRKCSSCKKPIPYGATYYVCSVSTCNRGPGYVFCSVACWDAHVPVMRHRKAWAEERTAPRGPDPEQLPLAERTPGGPEPASAVAGAQPTGPNSSPGDSSGITSGTRRRIRVRPGGAGNQATVRKARSGDEILVVASKIRDYIRARAGMNTSAGVYDVLSDRLRDLCDRAIDTARADGRKTVLDRDFE